MTVHDLKVVPPYFEPLESGRKPFEVRLDDRPEGFHVGDVLKLREWEPVAAPLDPSRPHPGRYTGRGCIRRVTYVLKGQEAVAFGIQPGYVVLGLGTEPAPPPAGRLMSGGQIVVQTPPPDPEQERAAGYGLGLRVGYEHGRRGR